MGKRVAAILGCLGMVWAVLTGPSPAGAQACYPPPCGVAVDSGPAGMNASVVTTPASTHDRRPAPYAAAGLLLVTATLTTLCVARRAEVRARGDQLPEPLGASAAPLREPEKSVA